MSNENQELLDFAVENIKEWLEAVKKKNSSQILERDKEYEIKVSGQEIALLALLTGNCNGSFTKGLWLKFESLINNSNLIGAMRSVELRTIQLYERESQINEYLDELFPTPETKELRQLKEQYAALGDRIKAMENK